MIRKTAPSWSPISPQQWAGLILSACLLAASLLVTGYLTPPKDSTDIFTYPPVFFCETDGEPIPYQSGNQCAAYASAYVLRHLGQSTDAAQLYPEIKRTLDFVSARSVSALFTRHGHAAQAYRGTIDTLKQRLTQGVPIIAFIRTPTDTHYVAVVGYDQENLYLADSLPENKNAHDPRYNRVLTTEEFQHLWSTGPLLPNNIYIVIDP